MKVDWSGTDWMNPDAQLFWENYQPEDDDVEEPWKSWGERYRFRWDALAATIDYYSTLMEDWD